MKIEQAQKEGYVSKITSFVKEYASRRIETGKKILRGTKKVLHVAWRFGAIVCGKIAPPGGKLLDLSNGMLSLLTAGPKFARSLKEYRTIRHLHFLWLANMTRFLIYGAIVVGTLYKVKKIYSDTLQSLFPSGSQNPYADGSSPASDTAGSSIPLILCDMTFFIAENIILINLVLRCSINNKFISLSNSHESQKLTFHRNKELTQYAKSNLDLTDLSATLNSMFRDLRAQGFSVFERQFIALYIAIISSERFLRPMLGPYTEMADKVLNFSLKVYAAGAEIDAYPLQLTGIPKKYVHQIQTRRKLICFGKGLVNIGAREGASFIFSLVKPRFLDGIDPNWFGPKWYRESVVFSPLESLFNFNYQSLQNIKLKENPLKEPSIDPFYYPREFTVQSLSMALSYGIPILGKAIAQTKNDEYKYYMECITFLKKVFENVRPENDPLTIIEDYLPEFAKLKKPNEFASIEDTISLLKSMASMVDWTDPSVRMFFHVYSEDLIKVLKLFKTFRNKGVLILLQYIQFFIPSFMGGEHIGLVLKYLKEKVPDALIDDFIQYIEKQSKFGEQNQHQSFMAWFLSWNEWRNRIIDNPDEEPEDYEFVKNNSELKEEMEMGNANVQKDEKISAEISRIYGCVGDYGFFEDGEAFKQVYEFLKRKLTNEVTPWNDEMMRPDEIDEARRENPVDPRASMDPYRAENLADKFERNSKELLLRLQDATSAFKQLTSSVTSITPGNLIRGAVSCAESAQERLGQITGAEYALNMAGSVAPFVIPGGNIVAGGVGFYNVANQHGQKLRFFAAWLDDKNTAISQQITTLFAARTHSANPGHLLAERKLREPDPSPSAAVAIASPTAATPTALETPSPTAANNGLGDPDNTGFSQTLLTRFNSLRSSVSAVSIQLAYDLATGVSNRVWPQNGQAPQAEQAQQVQQTPPPQPGQQAQPAPAPSSNLPSPSS